MTLSYSYFFIWCLTDTMVDFGFLTLIWPLLTYPVHKSSSSSRTSSLTFDCQKGAFWKSCLDQMGFLVRVTINFFTCLKKKSPRRAPTCTQSTFSALFIQELLVLIKILKFMWNVIFCSIKTDEIAWIWRKNVRSLPSNGLRDKGRNNWRTIEGIKYIWF